MQIRKVCILGAGTMGSQIAQLAATSGYEVSMVDLEDNIQQIAQKLMRLTEKNSRQKIQRLASLQRDVILNHNIRATCPRPRSCGE